MPIDYEKIRDGIRELVGEDTINVSFIKADKDKTLRHMKCRLTEATDANGFDHIREGLMAVWDIEADQHRRVNLNTIQSFNWEKKKDET